MTGCQSLSTQPDSSESSHIQTAANNLVDPKLPILDIPADSALFKNNSTPRSSMTMMFEEQWDLSLNKPNIHIENLVFAHPKVIHDSIWENLSQHLYLTYANRGKFDDYMKYFQRNKGYLEKVSKRSQPYLHFIATEVEKRHLPKELILLPIVESGFYPFAKSYVSATGLWQFMPSTGYMFGLERNWWYDGRQDIYTSTKAALDYLQKLYKQNQYDWLLALASYNAGYGNIIKARKKFLRKNPGKTRQDATYWEIRKYLPKETRHYVPQLLAVSYLMKHRERYGITFFPIEPKPYFRKINLRKQVSLAKISKRHDIAPRDLQWLNAGYLKPATPPKGPHTLLLPVEIANEFEASYIQNPQKYKVNWTKHKIKSGDSLSRIAQKYKTSVKAVKRLNGLRNNRIRAGKTLLIPVPQSYLTALDQSQKTKKFSGKRFYHRVAKGESLWSIAKYYNTTPRTLCEWNQISIRSPLYKGQKIEIRSSKYGKKLTYTLKKGDSLWTVAKKYKVTTRELSAWNGIKRTSVLQPGQKIQVWIKS